MRFLKENQDLREKNCAKNGYNDNLKIGPRN